MKTPCPVQLRQHHGQQPTHPGFLSLRFNGRVAVESGYKFTGALNGNMDYIDFILKLALLVITRSS